MRNVLHDMIYINKKDFFSIKAIRETGLRSHLGIEKQSYNTERLPDILGTSPHVFKD